MAASSPPIVLRTDAELNMGSRWPKDSAELFRVVTAPDDQVETLVGLVPEAQLLFTCYAPITAEVIAAGMQLQGIVKYGVGLDSVDLEAATARGIPVVHCPHYGTDTVADHAFALLMSLARRLPQIDRAMRAEGWIWPSPAFCGVDVAGKTIGLVGFGRIGKAMARRTSGFGMRRLVYDPYVPHESEAADFAFAPLERVLEEADFLSLHCVLTEETRGIIDAVALRRMKDSAFLINVSRGALVDQSALVDALREGRIAGAGLDVFPNEPLDLTHPLARCENVLLTPHFAFYTQEAHERLEQQCFVAARDLLDGRLPGPPAHVKNGEALKQRQSDLGGGAATAENVAPARSPDDVRAVPHRDERDSQTWRVTEGDVNLSSRRATWQRERLNETVRNILARDANVFMHQSLSTPCLTALRECQGACLVDEQGRRYWDFHGNSADQIGYRHPHVLAAIQRQMATLPFCPRRFTNQPAVELAEKLVALAPGRLGKVLFAPGGTSAMGMAMKLARYATGRYKTISMWDSFHGASLDAISIGGETLFRDGLGPLLPGCFHVPWPRDEADAAAIERILAEHPDVGAIIAEPMRCTTLERPSDAYWRRVRQLCDEQGVLLVFDEIPLALGRTGRMFCCEHSGVVPDVLVIGKGLGGGVFPMAAMLARGDLDIAGDYALGHYTHEKSPRGAAAALATIEVIESEGLLQRATDLGRRAINHLQRIQLPHSLETEVRGAGLAIAVELRLDGRPAIDQAQQVLYDCLSHGLSFKVSSGNVLTLTPPLTITDGEMDQALQIVEQAVARVSVTEGGQ